MSTSRSDVIVCDKQQYSMYKRSLMTIDPLSQRSRDVLWENHDVSTSTHSNTANEDGLTEPWAWTH